MLLTRTIRPVAVGAGIEKRIGWHTLRHTYSTMLPVYDVEIGAFIQGQTRTLLCPSTLELMPAQVDKQK